jgi:ribonuclease HI
MITLYVDGLCEPNPDGVACWGWVAFDADDRRVADNCGCIGPTEHVTNNVAEFEAAVVALRWAYRAGHTQILLYSDSKLLINIMTGVWEAGAPSYQSRYLRLQKALSFLDVTWRWVPREENTHADALSRKAFTRCTGQPPPVREKRRKSA